MDFRQRMKNRQKEEDKAEDSGDDTSGSEEDNVKFLFRSALDVGSTFLKILPDDEDMIFYHTRNNTLQAKCYLENLCPKSAVAYYGWTSHHGDFTIEPPYGFIKPGGYQYMTFTFKSTEHSDVNKGLYFIKALPLASVFDVDELSENIDDVFHEHNKRILFTLATLSGDYDLEEKAEDVVYDYHNERDNYIYSEEYHNKQKKKSKKADNTSAARGASRQTQPKKPEADDSMPDPEPSNSYQRDSDLLGLGDSSSNNRDTGSGNQAFIKINDIHLALNPKETILS